MLNQHLLPAASATVLSLILIGTNCISLHLSSSLLSRLITDRVSAGARIKEVADVLLAHNVPIGILCLINLRKSDIPWYFMLTIFLGIQGLALQVAFKTLPIKLIFRPEERRASVYGWQHWMDGDGFSKVQKCIQSGHFQAHAGEYIYLSQLELFLLAFFVRSLSHQLHGTEWIEIGVIACVLITIGAVANTAIATGGSNRRLLLRCFYATLGDGPRTKSDKGPDSIGIMRWEESAYLLLFDVARQIERSIPRLQKKLSARHFQEVADSYVSLAVHIRERAAQFHNSSLAYIDQLLWMAITIEANSNVLASARRIARVVPCSEEWSAKPSRFMRFVFGLDDFLAVHRRIFFTIGVLVVVIYYSYINDIASLVSFGRNILGG